MDKVIDIKKENQINNTRPLITNTRQSISEIHSKMILESNDETKKRSATVGAQVNKKFASIFERVNAKLIQEFGADVYPNLKKLEEKTVFPVDFLKTHSIDNSLR